ncbi:Uncharacterised protein [Cedecea neteri]|uniref:Uncharacterized protein n=1 Tax=Cedecea neteri TaxID=158822 RepID=A0A2X3IH28_9ENTR|nr:Uncharacterised protein [Cedecea neteri]
MSAENIINITEANLHQTLEQSVAKPVLFYFWSAAASTASSSRRYWTSSQPNTTGQFILAKVDCDAEQMVASQFGLRSHSYRITFSRMASR